MLRSLRSRLVWSQVVPLLVALPLMAGLLLSGLEGRVLIPQMARNLLGNARLLAEITTAEYELWGDPVLFQALLSRVQLSADVRVHFLDSRGTLLYSSDPADSASLGKTLDLSAQTGALSGQEVVLSNYSLFNLRDIYVDAFAPVLDASRQLAGVVRLTYRVGSLSDLLAQLRGLVLAALLAGLALSLVLGIWLAYSISRPVGEVTAAIRRVAARERAEPVAEKGPDELRTLAGAVNTLSQDLRGLESARRQLLANLVHELGRPLGALRSAIHALAGGAASDPDLLRDLTRGMDVETLRLQSLLDELASLYDRTLGALELEVKPVDTSAWLHDLLIPWQAAAAEKPLAWRDQVPPDLPEVVLDPGRTAQVIGNLLANAVKFTPARGVVTIRAGVSPAEFWVSVADTGPGIPQEERAQIFEPFTHGSSGGQRIKQGMGLGLSIARELAGAQDGRIELESAPGLGSTFTLRLPRRPGASPSPAEGPGTG